MYEVLARKWRPQTFDDVVGQEHVTRTLRNAIEADRIPHAILLTGPRGVGKTSIARIFAKALNCEKGPTGTPCSACSSCREISSSSSIDVLEIDAASHTKVEETRPILDNVMYLPAKGRRRVYIIDEVHMLSKHSFNALLKTLEEPPAHAVFIFATTNPEKVPATVRSRCQRFDLHRIDLEPLVRRLGEIVKEEKIEISEESLYAVGREAEGSVRDAQMLIDQIVSFSGQKPSDEIVKDLLNLVDRGAIRKAMRAILASRSAECLEILRDIYRQGHDLHRFLADLIELFRNLLVMKICDSPESLVDLPRSEIEELREETAPVEPEALQAVFDALMQGEAAVARSHFPLFATELLLVRASGLSNLLPIAEAIERLEAIERRLGAGGESSSRAASFTGSAEKGAGAARAAGVRDATADAAGTTEGAPERWGEFIEFVKGKSPKIGSLVAEVEPVHFSKESVGFRAAKSFTRETLSSPEKLTEIAEYLEEFYGTPRKVRFVDPAGAAEEPGAKKTAKAGKERTVRRTSKREAVRTAVEVLGGEIRKKPEGSE